MEKSAFVGVRCTPKANDHVRRPPNLPLEPSLAFRDSSSNFSLLAVPPPAPEGGKESHRILVADRVRLDIGDCGLMVLGVGIKDIKIGGEPCLVVSLNQSQRLLCGRERFIFSEQGLRIMVERPQGVGDLFKGAQYRLTI